ncbi:Phosphoglucosamine mutase [Giardia muris]|uniref:Phosphoglucosamine mutase n=1 Tax=Giardia muris TaxID=5742 RepID=A0A4Z1SV30_GIAMU|nr:Phosphoglucosamine mutase [Giardia muris]|eukprot:TNJ29530.1 Phosphoglucosamine mutase [Giardia muris]
MLIATFSGLRWTHDSEAPARIRRYTRAYAQALPSLLTEVGRDSERPHVYVGFDGRETGSTYPRILLASLLAAGIDVTYVGIVPTPTVQQLVMLKQASGGVIITASHNPPEWCGLKFVGPRSIFLTPEECAEVYSGADQLKDFDVSEPLEERVQEALDSTVGEVKYDSATLHVIPATTAIDEHINHVLSLKAFVDVEKIRAAKFSIAFSGCNAAGANYISQLCDSLGIKLAIPFGLEIGKLPKAPEPIPTNLVSFSEAILEGTKESPIDVAFAVDPDADRLVILDEKGIPIGEDLTLALCIDHVLGRCADKPEVVTNVSTSLAVSEACQKHSDMNAHLNYAAVGEVNVALKILELGDKCAIGGEGNGGVMLVDAHVGRDSIVAIVLVLSWLAERRGTTPTSILVREAFQTRHIEKAKFTFAEEEKAKLEEKLLGLAHPTEDFSDISTVDGVKFLSEKRGEWVHVRFSNTEPIIRIIAESGSVARSTELIQTYGAELELA